MINSKEVSLSFGLGIDQVSAETALSVDAKTKQSAARRIVNQDVTDTGTLVRRSGIELVVNMPDCHSLWSDEEGCYFVSEETMYSFDGTNTAVVASNLSRGMAASYARVADDVYWSNGIQSGVLVGGSNNVVWGSPTATGPLSQTYMQQIRGSIVRSYKGRLYIVDGRIIWATEPLDYMHVDMMRGFIAMESEVVLFEPVSGGIYVGTVGEGVRFLSGPDFKQFQLLNADSLTAVRGSGLSIDGAVFASTGQGAVWFTERGWVFGAGDGSTKRLTDKRLALPGYESAATLLREHEGMRQLMAFAKGGAESAAATDTVTTEVIRNGVLLV